MEVSQDGVTCCSNDQIKCVTTFVGRSSDMLYKIHGFQDIRKLPGITASGVIHVMVKTPAIMRWPGDSTNSDRRR